MTRRTWCTAPLSLQLVGFANTVCSARFGASTSQHSTQLHDGTQFLLVLAIADHAISGVNTLDDLWQLRIPDGDDELPLRWNDSVMHLPILRNATFEPLLKTTFDRIPESVLSHSGFFAPATVIDASFADTGFLARYTEVERSQHVLQGDPRVWGQSYVANIFAVCGRSTALDEPAQHDCVDYFQSFAKFHESGLPSKLPAREVAAISQHPQFLAFEAEVHRLISEHGSPSKIQAAVGKARACRLRLTRKRLQQYKLEWVRERRDWKVMTRGEKRAEDQSQTDPSDILTRVIPERGRLRRR